MFLFVSTRKRFVEQKEIEVWWHARSLGGLGYRNHVIGKLPALRKLDSNSITTVERDQARQWLAMHAKKKKAAAE
eukprot:m.131606 g.131606  ORF g.131606 m.131606 type:complete len:75 (+) comp20029_c0_seq5:462-686(+)